MSLTLRRPQQQKPVEIHNPYIAARREWDERYGDMITRARNWRALAVVEAFVAMMAIGGLLWMSARSHVVPFVVLVDSLGRPIASGIADQTSPADDRLQRTVIQDWVEQLRLVTTDGIAQRKAIDRVYAHIASGSAAQAFISEFYRNDPPFKRAQTDTVWAEIRSVLPISPHTYEVEWTETTRDLYGNVKATDQWKGSFICQISPPTDEAQARVNPLGLYVTAASWSKLL
jgi:type IV secretion system protein VirB5